MNRLFRVLIVFAASSAIALSSVYADIVKVQSRIVQISSSPTSKYIKVDRLDTQTDKTEEIKIAVDGSTLFGEAKSFERLKIGDEVTIEANYNAFTHEWTAQSIRPYEEL